MKLKTLALLSIPLLLSVACNTSPDVEVTPDVESTVPTSEPEIETSPVADNPDSTSATVAEQPMVEKAGTFIAAEHPTSGEAKIVVEGGDRYLEFGSDFQTDPGPDLVVILHRAEDIIATSEPPAYPIQEGDYITLAPLQNTSGTQRYSIPEDIDLAEYNSAAVWCRQFNATFGAATLN